MQRALARGEFELENLPMLTIPQRLLAGAMGLPFTTTRSLSGSSVGEEAAAAGSYLEIEDPFGSGETLGLLRAYQPDVALAHVWAADPAGNALVYPPFAENVYGLLAAKRGVILSAEKIVTTEFLRRHADHVHIPGEIVTAVCEAPYGSHPVGFYAEGIPGLRSYANDYEWIALHRAAARDEGIEVALMLETGVLGHDPRPADPFGFNFRNLPTARMLTDIFEILALHGGGAHNRCIGTVGAAQFDRQGNLNSTYGRDGSFLTGSGGANDIASTAREVAVVAALRPGSFVEKVDYVTSQGRVVESVTTNFGRFEKRDGELVLTGYMESAGPDRESVLTEIQSRCSFELRVADDLEALGAPSEEELALLRLFDPDRLFLGRVRT